ncbi:GPN-loop GTPase 1 [Glugoides intestinalis]
MTLTQEETPPATCVMNNSTKEASAAEEKNKTFVIVGMAGSGKTTFCQRLYSWLNTNIVLKNGLNANITSINLDPAVKNPKMPLTIDIRDIIDYKETMRKYALGPNGCINTCLNLFLLNFTPPVESKYTIVDTPGQIEAFTWSSPGEATMALLKDVCIVYIVDLSLCHNRNVFISNMLFAAALKCRFSRPVLVVFNKVDCTNNSPVSDWIKDYNSFREVLTDQESTAGSLALYFEEFYNSLDFVFVSSLFGSGKEEFMHAVNKIYA